MRQVKLTIVGRPLSKKRQYRRSKSGGIFLDKRWKEWEEDAMWQIKTQFPQKSIFEGPVEVEYKVYVKGKYHIDLDNTIVAFNDILQKVGVIKDDDLIKRITNSEKFGGSAGWSTKILIRSL